MLNGKSILAAVAMVVAIETWIFLFQSNDWDLNAYQAYARSCLDSSVEEMYSDYTVEYPPVAIALMVATEAVSERLPDCSRLGRTFDPYDYPSAFANFKVVYRFEMAVVIFSTFLLMVLLLKKLVPGGSTAEGMERVAVFCGGLGMLAPFAFDRLDAAMGALILLALALMLSRCHYFWSFLVLALAVAFKIMPVVLIPLWVLGSLTFGLRRPLQVVVNRSMKLTIAFAVRGMLIAALIVGWFIPFLVLGGRGCLTFLTFHKDRGLEFESTYATLLGVLKWTTGMNVTASSSFGSYNIDSSISPMLARLAPAIMATLLVAATLLLIAKVARTVKCPSLELPATSSRFARSDAAGFTAHTILLVLIFLFANKVFSLQYLFWVIPLAPLAPFPRGLRRIFHACFLALCLVTNLIYPHYLAEVLGTPLPSDPGVFSGPSHLGVSLLLIHTLLLSGMIACVAVYLTKRLGFRRFEQNSPAF